MKLKEMIFFALALLCLADSIILTFRSSVTLGLFMMYGLTGVLFAYAFFHSKIDAFCSHLPESALRILFFCGVAFFLFLVGVMTVSSFYRAPTGEEQVVIVLGAGLRGERVSDTLRRRLDRALEYYQEHPGCLLILSGGQGPDEILPEAEAMSRYLQERGVPSEDLLLEDRSTSTQENFAFSLDLMRQRGLDEDTPILFVTNRYHCYRAAQYAQKVGFTEVRVLPCSTSLIYLPSAVMREAVAICALWAGLN